MQQILEQPEVRAKLLSDILIEADGKVRQIKSTFTDTQGGFCARGLLYHIIDGWKGDDQKCYMGNIYHLEYSTSKVNKILPSYIQECLANMNNIGASFRECGEWLAEQGY